MRIMKYITVQLFEPGGLDIKKEVVAVLFPIVEGLSHRDVASLHRAGQRAIVSAGFCEVDFENKSVFVYSESETLKMKPKDGDDRIISQLLGFT